MRRGVTYLLLFVAVMLLATPVRAATVPADLQAKLFSRLFRYDKDLNWEAVRVLVIVDQENHNAAKELVAAFIKQGLVARTLSSDEFLNIAHAGDVAYVFSASSAHSIENTRKKGNILTITADADLVEHGVVAMGLAVEKGRPRILLNLKRLRAQGHHLQAAVVGLARRY